MNEKLFQESIAILQKEIGRYKGKEVVEDIRMGHTWTHSQFDLKQSSTRLAGLEFSQTNALMERLKKLYRDRSNSSCKLL